MGSARHRSPDPPRMRDSSYPTRAFWPSLCRAPAVPLSTHGSHPHASAVHLAVCGDGHTVQAILKPLGTGKRSPRPHGLTRGTRKVYRPRPIPEPDHADCIIRTTREPVHPRCPISEPSCTVIPGTRLGFIQTFTRLPLRFTQTVSSLLAWTLCAAPTGPRLAIRGPVRR